ncbi:MAG TPA: lipopolysaccharide heptosyltransferase II [Lacipirellulaceae bacterium]
MRLGIFLPNWLGDVVMATPAIRALRELVGPQGRLIGIMRPYVSDVLSGANWFDETILYEKQLGRFGFASRCVYDRLRCAELDRVVLLTNSLRTAWMAFRSGARERIGYAGDMRSWLLTKSFPRPRAPLATVDGYLQLASAAGAKIESRRLELKTTAADERAADMAWETLRLPSAERVVLLNSGGAYGAAKRWPAEHFAELARRIVFDAGYPVLVNCGPAERTVAQEIEALADDPRVVSLARFDELPIGLTKACIRRSRVVVSTDSGPRHIAIAFGKPVVTLFGPTDPAATAIDYDRETCLSLWLDCQPCMARECPLGHHRCMRELTVETVYAAVRQVLNEEIATDAA